MKLTGLYSGIFVLLLASTTAFPVQAATEPKCYQDLVCDSADLFSDKQFHDLSIYHEALLERYDIDYRVIILPDAGDMPARAVNIFKTALVGSRSKTKKGLLLLIDPEQDKVRLEISAGLDAVYTDGFTAYLQQRQMIPFFKAGRVVDGILATTEIIVTRAQEAQEGKEFIPPEQLPENLAIGAGAQTEASIGTGYTSAPATGTQTPKPAGMNPEQVVAAYHYTLAHKNAASDLDIYSQATQELKKKWVVTPAQMANELKAYKKCEIDKTIYVANSTKAVVRYKVEQRACAPYFLAVEDGAWRLDFLVMMENIRFNVDNEWHFDMRKPLPYADAFLDWDFNKDGYPFPQQKMRWGIMVETDYRHDVTWIKKIYPETPAASMPLHENDVVLSWNGIKNPNHVQVTRSMDSLSAGKTFKIEVIREGQPLTIEVTAPPKI